MKTKLTLLALLVSFVTIAQQGFNYKAVIKDDLGNVVANQQIIVEFSILQGTSQTNVYSTRHEPTTDANGIIVLSIGNGTLLSGNFYTINWGSNSHYLNVKCDIGNGLVDLGTTVFQKVPYAKHADVATTANNVSGLEYYTDTYSGWRLIGLDPDGYGDIGLKAVDLSIGSGNSNIYGALGNFSFATGTSTIASGVRATAMGNNTTASGDNSTAMGYSTIALGESSSAIGYQTQTKSFGETALGMSNTDYSPNQPASWWGTDRLMVVGNGNNTPSDALIILKNGTITAPSLDLPEIVDAKTLITKEYADINLGGSGLEALDEGNGIGWRIKGRDPADFGTIGFHAIDLSFSNGSLTTFGATGFGSTALGRNTIASESYATVMGSASLASGIVSTAMGASTVASGTSSTAMGSETVASGYASTAMGENTEASGRYSIAMGNQTIASSFNETAMGSFNINSNGNPSSWIMNEPIVSIGNGEGESNRSNALTILKNGNVALGNITPSSSTIENVLDVGGRIRLRPKIGATTSTSGIWYSDAYGLYSQFAGAKKHSPTAAIREWGIYIDGYKFWVNGDGNATLSGSLSQNSDRRLKKDITDLTYGLTEILQLQPKQYFWKDRTEQEQASLGLIAQDVEKVIANIVHEGNDKDKTLSLSYIELIPVLINAIKEQQKVIENQDSKINNLTTEVNQLQALATRIKQLELILKTEKP